MHVIDSGNYQEAANALRDILMMYVFIAEERWFDNGDAWIGFDPLKYIDADTDGASHYVDIDLLRSGSGIAVLCAFYNNWSEEHPLLDRKTTNYIEAVRQGRFQAVPDIAALLLEAVRRERSGTLDSWFAEAGKPIYLRYIRGFFKRLGDQPYMR